MQGVFSFIFLCCASAVSAARVANGEIASEGQFPWHVGVISMQTSLLSYCGGAIISEEWILTAAHCVYDADDVAIYYGSLKLLDDSEGKTVVSDGWNIHQDFDNETLWNDIAVIHLSNPISFNDDIKAVDLANEELEAGVEVTVSGFGSSTDDPDDENDILRYITVTTIDNEECLEVYGSDIILPGVVCTKSGSPVKNPCRGDGGDPVVINAVHVAIFSFLSSFGCESGDYPAGYTRTAYYRNWIRDVSGV